MSEPEGVAAHRSDTGGAGTGGAGRAKGRTFLVTGANTGIGRATAAGLARQGGRVYIAVRSREKGEEAVAGLRASTGNDAVFYLPLDLADGLQEDVHWIRWRSDTSVQDMAIQAI